MLDIRSGNAITFQNCFIKNVFHWDYNVCKSWSYEIKEIFDSINKQHVYITKSVRNMVTIETKCKELVEYQWLQSVPSKHKTYNIY